jgi:hypothetical protein
MIAPQMVDLVTNHTTDLPATTLAQACTTAKPPAVIEITNVAVAETIQIAAPAIKLVAEPTHLRDLSNQMQPQIITVVDTPAPRASRQALLLDMTEAEASHETVITTTAIIHVIPAKTRMPTIIKMMIADATPTTRTANGHNMITIEVITTTNNATTTAQITTIRVTTIATDPILEAAFKARQL